MTNLPKSATYMDNYLVFILLINFATLLCLKDFVFEGNPCVASSVTRSIPFLGHLRGTGTSSLGSKYAFLHQGPLGRSVVRGVTASKRFVFASSGVFYCLHTYSTTLYASLAHPLSSYVISLISVFGNAQASLSAAPRPSS